MPSMIAPMASQVRRRQASPKTCHAPRHFFATEPLPSREHWVSATMTSWNKHAGGAASRRHGGHGALANKRAADIRARALVSIIHELMAAGFLSRRSLADELNRRGIPTALGGRWQYTTVVRTLTYLGWPRPEMAWSTMGRQTSRPRTCELKPCARQFLNSGQRAFSPTRPSRAS
jgi:hypothetical protein